MESTTKPMTFNADRATFDVIAQYELIEKEKGKRINKSELIRVAIQDHINNLIEQARK